MVAAGTNPQTLESEGQGGEEGHGAWVITEGWIQLSNVVYKGQKQHPEHQALAPRSAVGGALFARPACTELNDWRFIACSFLPGPGLGGVGAPLWKEEY